jgi:membrane-associated protease RseP (regulator of RpoE activity)
VSEHPFERSVSPFAQSFVQARLAWPHRWWWLQGFLFVITVVTTTVYGAAVSACFDAREPLNTDLIWAGYSLLLHGNPNLLQGLRFSIPLLLILLAHELGHYFASRRWQVEATLPFFLPSPFLLGTFGAFIRIKTPIYSRKALFDIGVSGPTAGFLVLLPLLATGIALSQTVPHLPAGGDIVFGTPLLIRVGEWLRFGSTPVEQVALHPFAQAAWAGLLATAINLLPIGQLDGGHILYALFGPLHKMLSRIFVAVLVPMGYFSYSWLFWALLLLILGVRHPLVYDDEPLDRNRKSIAMAALLIFVLSISLTPVRLR